MLNIDDNILEIKKYIKRLNTSLTNDVVFSWGSTKLIKKTRIDDLMCCLEATMPQEYKKYSQKPGTKKLQSIKTWNDLNTTLKNKFFLSDNLYVVKSEEALSLLQSLQKTIEQDIKFVYSAQADMMF